MKLTELSAADMRRAADLKDKITAYQQELLSIFGMADQPEPQVERQPRLTKGRRKMSAEARAKISRAMKKRWRKAWAKGNTTL